MLLVEELGFGGGAAYAYAEEESVALLPGYGLCWVLEAEAGRRGIGGCHDWGIFVRDDLQRWNSLSRSVGLLLD